jgi:hypothetical protein
MNDFNEMYLGRFRITPTDKYLAKLAEEYHTTCEAYDEKVCTGPNSKYGILPANSSEAGAIGKHAREVMRRLKEKAIVKGILPKDVEQAIKRRRR